MYAFPEIIKVQLQHPCYHGSVQNLYDVPDHPDLLISETTAGGSVFDVGTIFTIEGSDIGRAGFRHMVFQELHNPDAWKALSKTITGINAIIRKDTSGRMEKVLSRFCSGGAPTHHGGMVDRNSGKVYRKGFPPMLSTLTLIRKFETVKPVLCTVLGWHFYDYYASRRRERFVIPLEYIVRLGVTSGSSILKKYTRLGKAEQKKFLNELGVEVLSPWSQFEHPIVDLTTKYEPTDRHVSRQEAALISALDGETFAESMIMAILGACLIRKIFSDMGLFLWDLKWEIACDGKDLAFVDTIDTDSVRVTMNVQYEGKSYFVHFNKQSMRDYYKIMHSDWYNAVNMAKNIADQQGRPFPDVLAEGQKRKEYPDTPVIDEYFLDIQKEKFELILRFIKYPGQDLRKEAQRIAGRELDYYVKAGKIKQYDEINSFPLPD